LIKPIALTAAVAAVGGGIAYASIPDSAGVFHACVHNGALRLIDPGKGQTCRARERAVSWNARGPQGPQGRQGDPGANGDPGPSDAWHTVNSSPLPLPKDGSSGTVAAISNLPPGAYVVHALLSLGNGEHVNRFLSCDLEGNLKLLQGDAVEPSVSVPAADNQGQTNVMFPLQGAAQLTLDNNLITVVCHGGVGDPIGVAQATIDAIKVGSLHTR
jgi:hypothetical protein